MTKKPISLALLCCFFLAHSAMGADRPTVLGVEISAGKDSGYLNYKLKNVSDNEIEFGIMSCSTWDHWVIESKEVVISWPIAACDKNYCSPKKIGVAASIEGVLPIRKISNSQKDVPVQIGFKPCTPRRGVPPGVKNVDHLLKEETYWSDSLKVKTKSIPMLGESEKGRLNIGNKPPSYKGGIQLENK